MSSRCPIRLSMTTKSHFGQIHRARYRATFLSMKYTLLDILPTWSGPQGNIVCKKLATGVEQVRKTVRLILRHFVLKNIEKQWKIRFLTKRAPGSFLTQFLWGLTALAGQIEYWGTVGLIIDSFPVLKVLILGPNQEVNTLKNEVFRQKEHLDHS